MTILRYPARLLVLFAVLVAAGVPRTGHASSGLVLLSGFPTLKQQHALTCESSAASMGTEGALTETQIMAAMPRSPNPNLGFRGNPDGLEGATLANYGVYANPVHRALLHFGYQSTVLTYASRQDIKDSIDQGWPVVAWITYNLQAAKPRLGSFNGVSFTLVPHEHAVLVVGYDSKTVFVNDPWTGKLTRYNWGAFQRSWGLFGNMALSMQPCPAPAQVKKVTVDSMSTAGVTWTWPRARNAVAYNVKLIRHAPTTDITVAKVVQPVNRFTLTTPLPGGIYEIVIRSRSSCGGLAAPIHLWLPLPSVLPAPSPTPVPVASPTVNPNPSATPTHSVPTSTPVRPSATPTAHT
jgi:uncharacterized protein YvpB